MSAYTLTAPVSLSGTGIHTGVSALVTLKGAPEGHGIVFYRMDLPGQPALRASAAHVSPSPRCTLLKSGETTVHTPEHLLAVLTQLGLWDVRIEVNGPEIPILDGSAMPWLQELLPVRAKKKTPAKNTLYLKERIEWHDPSTGAHFIAEPHPRLDVTIELDYPSEAIGPRKAHWNQDQPLADIARARTFSFLHEIKPLLQAGLLQGVALGCGVVYVHPDHTKEDDLSWAAPLGGNFTSPLQPGPLPQTPTLMENEAARHKCLDLIGDLALLEAPLCVKITAIRPGHAANNAFAKLLLEKMETTKNLTPPWDINAAPLMDVVQIMNVLPHRPPFLLVDRILEMSEDHVVGTKAITMNEPFFTGHFPGAPVMPGVLIIEAMAQCGGILALSTVPDPENYLTYFLKMDEVKFKQKVIPGDTLVFVLTLLEPIRRGIVKMSGKAYVGDKLTTEALLTALITKDK